MNLPNGSLITVDTDHNERVVSIPRTIGLCEGARVAFSCLFLIPWTFGFTFAVGSLGESGADLFLFVWLIGWSIGGATVALDLIRAAINSPETIKIASGRVVHHPGLGPVPCHFANNVGYVVDSYTWPRTTDFGPEHFSSLKLCEHEGATRLTMDSDRDRIELGRNASEVEREWLYDFLKSADLSEGRAHKVSVELDHDTISRPLEV